MYVVQENISTITEYSAFHLQERVIQEIQWDRSLKLAWWLIVLR